MKIHVGYASLSHDGEEWAPGQKWGHSRDGAQGMTVGQAFTAVSLANWSLLFKPQFPHL